MTSGSDAGQPSEHGRFLAAPNGSLRFAGSASGIWFADMVRFNVPSLRGANAAEIEQAFVDRNNITISRDALGGFIAESAQVNDSVYRSQCLRPDQLVNKAETKRLFDEYFSTWHPLLPFQDGKAAFAYFNRLFEAKLTDAGDAEALLISAVISSIVGIGALGQTDTTRSDLPAFSSSRAATSMAYMIVDACDESLVNDIEGLQALVAITLYLYATRKHRQASHLCGVIIRLAFEAGLHRCPGRYPVLFASPAHSDMRKRLLYSIYVLDRLLALELGSPIMLSDTDIDVCLPGATEKHGPLQPNGQTAGHKRKRQADTLPDLNHSASYSSPFGASIGSSAYDRGGGPSSDAIRLRPAQAMIRITAISGRLMDTFNKSRKYRANGPGHLEHLRADIDEWWNEMDFDAHDENKWRSRHRILFTGLYHQQIMHFHRQALSVRPDQVQHRHALQSVVISARKICFTLSSNLGDNRHRLFWPGFVDMIFFSSLVLVYAAQQRQEDESIFDIRSDLRRALQVAHILQDRWGHLASLLRVVQALVDNYDENSDGAQAPIIHPVLPSDSVALDGSCDPIPFADLLDLDFLRFFH